VKSALCTIKKKYDQRVTQTGNPLHCSTSHQPFDYVYGGVNFNNLVLLSITKQFARYSFLLFWRWKPDAVV